MTRATLARAGGDQARRIGAAVAQEGHPRGLMGRECTPSLFEEFEGLERALKEESVHIDRSTTNSRIAKARSLTTDREALAALALDRSVRVVIAVAENVATPGHVLDRLCDHRDERVRRAALRNPSLPKERILAEIERQDEDRLYSLVCNRSLDREVIETMASSSNGFLRGMATQIAGCPEDIIDRLIEDEDFIVRQFCAESLNATPSHLVHLVQDDDSYVRRAAFENPRLPASALHIVVRDRDRDLASEAVERMATMMEMRLGVHTSNKAARDMLMGDNWWEMTRDDPRVQMALMLCPNWTDIPTLL